MFHDALVVLTLSNQIYMSPDGTALSTYEQLDKYKHFVRIYTRGGILAEEMVLLPLFRAFGLVFLV